MTMHRGAYLIRIQSHTGRWNELTEEEYLELRTAVPGLDPEKQRYPYGVLTVGWEGMEVLAKLGIAIEFDRDDALGRGSGLMWVKLQDRIKQLELDRDDAAKLTLQGGGVHVHVPDLALMCVDEVTWLEDACTEELQRMLDEGWRILAVCPPNARRRPDYILGRRKRAGV